MISLRRRGTSPSAMIFFGCLVVGLLIAPTETWAQLRDEVITVNQAVDPGPYTANFTGQPAAAAITLRVSLDEGQCEDILFANATGGAIVIRNTSSPAGEPLKPQGNVPAGGTGGTVTLCCPDDVGQWLFEIGDGVGGDADAVLTVNVTCKIPALSTWGAIVMVGLLLVAATLVWGGVRSKTDSVPVA